MNKKIILLLFACFSFASLSLAQNLERSVLSGLGGSNYNSNFQIDYTLGETITASVQTGTFTITQGFQQPILDSTANPGDSSNTITPLHKSLVEYTLYPNPASNEINIKLESNINTSVYFNIIDIKGKVVYRSQKALALPLRLQQRFSVAQLAAGTYFLQILDSNHNPVASIKWIKQE